MTVKSYQYSLRTILVATFIVALCVAFPGIAWFAPTAIVILMLVLAATLFVGFIQWALANDRRPVAAYTWKQIRGLLFAIACVAAYLAYAIALVTFAFVVFQALCPDVNQITRLSTLLISGSSR